MMKKWSKFWQNPVLITEYQWRMRIKATPWIIFCHLFFMGMMIFLAFFMFTLDESIYSLKSGTTVFTVFSYLQLCMVALIVPAITSGLISSEREKQTLSLLLVTTLSSKEIILGKWFSSVSFMLLLYLSTLPLYLIIYNFGGVSLDNVMRVFLHLLVSMFFLSSVGIFFSTIVKRTGVSTILSYLVVMIWGIGSILFIYFIWMTMAVVYNALDIPSDEIPLLIKLLLSLHPAVSMVFVLDTKSAVSIFHFDNSIFPAYFPYFIFYTFLTIFLLKCSAYFLSPKRDHQKE